MGGKKRLASWNAKIEGKNSGDKVTFRSREKRPGCSSKSGRIQWETSAAGKLFGDELPNTLDWYSFVPMSAYLEEWISCDLSLKELRTSLSIKQENCGGICSGSFLSASTCSEIGSFGFGRETRRWSRLGAGFNLQSLFSTDGT